MFVTLQQDFPPGIPSGQTKFQFVNPSSCPVNVRDLNTDQTYNMEPLKVGYVAATFKLVKLDARKLSLNSCNILLNFDFLKTCGSL